MPFKNWTTEKKQTLLAFGEDIYFNTKIPSSLFLFDLSESRDFQQNSGSGLSHRNAHGLGQAPCVSNTSPGSWRDFQNPRLAEGLLHMACFRRSRQHKDLVQVIPSIHQAPFKANTPQKKRPHHLGREDFTKWKREACSASTCTVLRNVEKTAPLGNTNSGTCGL